MNKELEQRIERLPQWAQQYISKLQRDNDALRAERGKIADGDAKITFTINFDEVYGVPDRATIGFQLGNDTIEFLLETTLNGDIVCVRSSHHRLVIEPSTSNAINLSVKR